MPNVEIVVNAIDNASGGLSGINTAFQKMTGFSLSAAGAVAAVVAIGKKVVDYYVEGTQKLLAYNEASEKFGRLAGIATEEAQKFVVMADRLDISQQTLATSMNILAKSGIAPTIENLGMLADQYNALTDPVARAQFIQANFGRGGQEIIKILELQSSGIQKLNQDIEANNALTQKQLNMTNLLELAQNSRKSSTEALQMQITSNTIPAQLKWNMAMVDASNKNIEFVKTTEMGKMGFMNWKTEFQNGTMAVLGFLGILGPTHQAMMNVDGTGIRLGNTFIMLADDAKESAQAIADATKTNENYISELGHWATMQTTYSTNMSTEQGKLADLYTEYDKAVLQGYWLKGEKIQGILGKIAAEQGTVEDLAAAHDKETKSVILGYMQQILARDGLTTAEVQALIDQGVQWGIYDKDTQAVLDAAILKAQNLTDIINNTPKHVVSQIDLVTVLYTIQGGVYKGRLIVGDERSASTTVSNQQQDFYHTPTYHPDTGTWYASGGFIGTAASGGFRNNRVMVGEAGAEIVDLPTGSYVHNNSETKQMMGGGLTQAGFDKSMNAFITKIRDELSKGRQV